MEQEDQTELEWTSWIEEHQAGDLVFAQIHYLYIQLEATSAYVIIPMAIVPRFKYSSYQ